MCCILFLRLLLARYKLKDMGHDVFVNWQYDDDDEDMHEVGNDYAFMVETPFVFVKTSSLKVEPELV